jgi:hypothetical protein
MQDSLFEPKDGKLALRKDVTVKKVNELEDESRGTDSRRSKISSLSNDDFQREITEDPEQAVKKNRERFDKMFEIQSKQIEDVERSVREQADRIINVVLSGPHSRLIDPVRRFGFGLHLLFIRCLSGYIQLLGRHGVFHRALQASLRSLRSFYRSGEAPSKPDILSWSYGIIFMK